MIDNSSDYFIFNKNIKLLLVDLIIVIDGETIANLGLFHVNE